MAASTDLWGDIQTAATVRTPLSILKEQAALLSQKTQNLLQGQVATAPNPWEVRHSFQIVVPALDDYAYELFYISHKVADFYPITGGNGIVLNSEDEFTEWLGQTLTLPETKRIISNLLAQARS